VYRGGREHKAEERPVFIQETTKSTAISDLGDGMLVWRALASSRHCQNEARGVECRHAGRLGLAGMSGWMEGIGKNLPRKGWARKREHELGSTEQRKEEEGEC
jgi:hypothetical protein